MNTVTSWSSLDKITANPPSAELLLKANQLKGLEKPSSRDYRSVLRYMEKKGDQLYEEEMKWIYEKEDLVTLRPGREHAWLDGILERILKLCRGKIVRVSKSRQGGYD